MTSLARAKFVIVDVFIRSVDVALGAQLPHDPLWAAIQPHGPSASGAAMLLPVALLPHHFVACRLQRPTSVRVAAGKSLLVATTDRCGPLGGGAIAISLLSISATSGATVILGVGYLSLAPLMEGLARDDTPAVLATSLRCSGIDGSAVAHMQCVLKVMLAPAGLEPLLAQHLELQHSLHAARVHELAGGHRELPGSGRVRSDAASGKESTPPRRHAAGAAEPALPHAAPTSSSSPDVFMPPLLACVKTVSTAQRRASPLDPDRTIAAAATVPTWWGRSTDVQTESPHAAGGLLAESEGPPAETRAPTCEHAAIPPSEPLVATPASRGTAASGTPGSSDQLVGEAKELIAAVDGLLARLRGDLASPGTLMRPRWASAGPAAAAAPESVGAGGVGDVPAGAEGQRQSSVAGASRAGAEEPSSRLATTLQRVLLSLYETAPGGVSTVTRDPNSDAAQASTAESAAGCSESLQGGDHVQRPPAANAAEPALGEPLQTADAFSVETGVLGRGSGSSDASAAADVSGDLLSRQGLGAVTQSRAPLSVSPRDTLPPFIPEVERLRSPQRALSGFAAAVASPARPSADLRMPLPASSRGRGAQSPAADAAAGAPSHSYAGVRHPGEGGGTDAEGRPPITGVRLSRTLRIKLAVLAQQRQLEAARAQAAAHSTQRWRGEDASRRLRRNAPSRPVERTAQLGDRLHRVQTAEDTAAAEGLRSSRVSPRQQQRETDEHRALGQQPYVPRRYRVAAGTLTSSGDGVVRTRAADAPSTKAAPEGRTLARVLLVEEDRPALSVSGPTPAGGGGDRSPSPPPPPSGLPPVRRQVYHGVTTATGTASENRQPLDVSRADALSRPLSVMLEQLSLRTGPVTTSAGAATAVPAISIVQAVKQRLDAQAVADSDAAAFFNAAFAAAEVILDSSGTTTATTTPGMAITGRTAGPPDSIAALSATAMSDDSTAAAVRKNPTTDGASGPLAAAAPHLFAASISDEEIEEALLQAGVASTGAAQPALAGAQGRFIGMGDRDAAAAEAAGGRAMNGASAGDYSQEWSNGSPTATSRTAGRPDAGDGAMDAVAAGGGSPHARPRMVSDAGAAHAGAVDESGERQVSSILEGTQSSGNLSRLSSLAGEVAMRGGPGSTTRLFHLSGSESDLHSPNGAGPRRDAPVGATPSTGTASATGLNNSLVRRLAVSGSGTLASLALSPATAPALSPQPAASPGVLAEISGLTSASERSSDLNMPNTLTASAALHASLQQSIKVSPP